MEEEEEEEEGANTQNQKTEILCAGGDAGAAKGEMMGRERGKRDGRRETEGSERIKTEWKATKRKEE